MAEEAEADGISLGNELPPIFVDHCARPSANARGNEARGDKKRFVAGRIA
jgi:hypothetical protein